MSAMPRRYLVVLLVLLMAPLVSAQAPVPAPRSDAPNVLLIVADDLNVDLGAYGAPVHTPHIDALAARGVRFDRAYTQFPLCNPSRSSFLSGRRPNATGVLANPANTRLMSPHLREKLPEAVTWPQFYRNNGYFVARIGKLYHYGVPSDIGTSSLDDYRSWDLVVNPRGHDRDAHDRITTIGEPGNFGATLSWMADEAPDGEQTDGLAAAEAERLLERFAREKRHFFLGVGFYRPHTPFVAPKWYFDLYDPGAMTVAPLSTDDRARTPKAAYATSRDVEDKLEEVRRREAIRAYRASISFMDAQVGVVLRALERVGLTDRTIVIFASDHGYHLGDHGLWQKSTLFERSTRVPLIIAAPGIAGRGRATRGLAELVDLYRTTADLTGLTPPGEIEGTSLRPLLENPAASVKPYAFTQIRNGYAVRSERYRYIEWDAGAEGAQLFDMEQDANETRNLADDPAHAEVRKQLSKVLAAYRASGEAPTTRVAPR
jgi:arylsulfatase A-like enzyme